LGNILGIDYGESKVGVAHAPSGSVAFRLKIIANDKLLFPSLEEIVEKNEIDAIVVGLPLNMDGTLSAQTDNVRKFIDKLKDHLKDIEILTYDERLTSVEAGKNISPGEEDDQEAARLILQGYLDKNRGK